MVLLWSIAFTKLSLPKTAHWTIFLALQRRPLGPNCCSVKSSNRKTVEELTIDAKIKVKRRQSILIVKHAKKFNESKRAKLQRRKRNRQIFHQLQHTVKNKERLKTGTHRRFSTLNFRKELEQSSIGLQMFKEQKTNCIKQRKYSLLNCVHVANERCSNQNHVVNETFSKQIQRNINIKLEKKKRMYCKRKMLKNYML